MHPSSLSEEQLLKDCSTRNDRRSGPGGQHRNKVETAVIVLHEPTGIAAEASERRSQADNRRVAIGRLRLNLAVGHRESVPNIESEAWQPSALWQSRRKGTQIAVSAEHADFPAVLAEALDVLHASKDELPLAARRLGLSASQLTKLFRKHSPALQAVNARRLELGLRKLV